MRINKINCGSVFKASAIKQGRFLKFFAFYFTVNVLYKGAKSGQAIAGLPGAAPPVLYNERTNCLCARVQARSFTNRLHGEAAERAVLTEITVLKLNSPSN